MNSNECFKTFLAFGEHVALSWVLSCIKEASLCSGSQSSCECTSRSQQSKQCCFLACHITVEVVRGDVGCMDSSSWIQRKHVEGVHYMLMRDAGGLSAEKRLSPGETK